MDGFFVSATVLLTRTNLLYVQAGLGHRMASLSKHWTRKTTQAICRSMRGRLFLAVALLSAKQLHVHPTAGGGEWLDRRCHDAVVPWRNSDVPK